jgi:energy-coupling factor transporter transmembrane protein EcfT
MAELIFSFRQTDSPLHDLDARFKLAILVSVSAASLRAGPFTLALATISMLVFLGEVRFSLKQLVKELRYFLVVLGCVFIARALTTPGDPFQAVSWMSISHQGVVVGILLAWRLLLIALLGILLTVTTRPGHIRSAIEWFLRPIPLIPHHKVATMIGLLVRFIPVILSQSSEIGEALSARAIENRKNPLRRFSALCMPLLRKTFITADRLALAMEARCYGPVKTTHLWRTTSRDWAALVIAGFLCTLMLFF